VTIVDWVSTLPVYPPAIEGWTLEARKAHMLEMEYRMTILRYVLAMADSIMFRDVAAECTEPHVVPLVSRVLLDAA
jgi:hypothetical protein